MTRNQMGTRSKSEKFAVSPCAPTTKKIKKQIYGLHSQLPGHFDSYFMLNLLSPHGFLTVHTIHNDIPIPTNALYNLLSWNSFVKHTEMTKLP
jgi:hypothetical protein